MRTNKLVWLGLAGLVFMAGVVVINKVNDNGEPQLAQGQEKAVPKKQSHVKVRPNSVEGDTVVETLSEVTARYEEKDAQIKKQDEIIQKLTSRLESVEQAQGRSKSGDNPIDKVMGKLEAMSGNFESLSQQFSNQAEMLSTTTANGYSFSQSELGWGGDAGTAAENPYKTTGVNRTGGQQSTSASTKLSGYVSVVPLVKGTADQTAMGVKSLTNKATGTSLTGLKEKKSEVKPVYTIPARATLLDNVAMTALIGRVPIGDKLKSPFPAKIIVGNKNLATNGIKIPGLKGIVFEGIASGNWNLSCVSVHLTAATFTFNDGRIQHLYGQDSANMKRGMESSSLSPISGELFEGSIGYVSDNHGVPCIPGKRITDAHKQVATLSLLGMGAGYFEGRANTEVTTSVDTDGAISSVTGDDLKYAYNNMLADGAESVVDFYKDRFRDTFDAIVAPPGVKLTLHISKDLLVDYDPNARKVVYSANDHGGLAHALD